MKTMAIKHWNDATLPNPETTTGAQSKADAAVQAANNYTDSEVAGALTAASSYTDTEVSAALATAASDAQAKADAAVTSAALYTEGLVEDAKIHADTRAAQAESNAKAYADQNFMPIDGLVQHIRLVAPNDEIYELSVGNDGSLITTLI